MTLVLKAPEESRAAVSEGTVRHMFRVFIPAFVSDLVAQGDFFLHRFSHTEERLVEHTAGFPRLDHRDVETAEDFRVLRQRLRQRLPLLDIRPNGAQDPGEA